MSAMEKSFQLLNWLLNLREKKIIDYLQLGKGPKIKKRESMVFDHTPLTPPLTLTMVFLLNFFSPYLKKKINMI